jgi:anaerobic selenocysteine-containing dehydrogenase
LKSKTRKIAIKITSSVRFNMTSLNNPLDAECLGLEHGGQALVRARVGQQQLEVSSSDEIMPGVFSIARGFGHRYADTGQSIASVKMPGFSANDRVDDEVLEGASVINGVPSAISALPV